MIIWVIAGLLGLATGVRIGWALVNKQSLVSSAMIVALGSLGAMAALNWQPLALLIDTLLHWPNIAMALSQVALIACAAGSCVMITTAASERTAAVAGRIATAQYVGAGVVAAISLVTFFAAKRQPEMAPGEYLRRNVGSGGMSWVLPLLYVLLVLTLVAWVGLRYSNRSRRGRALFVFTVGIALIVAVSAFFLIRLVSRTNLLSVGAAVTILGCAMVIVALGSLLPSMEDWFAARQELRTIAPLLAELGRRQPDVGIGVRPRGPLVFRVAERMSLISDSLYLEATAAASRDGGPEGGSDVSADDGPDEQARTVARWIYDTRAADDEDSARGAFPGLSWLRQPQSYSDREWILAIADQYRALTRARNGR